MNNKNIFYGTQQLSTTYMNNTFAIFTRAKESNQQPCISESSSLSLRHYHMRMF